MTIHPRLISVLLIALFLRDTVPPIPPSGKPKAELKRPKPPRYSMEPIIRSDSAVCVIPFSRAGNLIIVRATVDSIEGNFILDTGAPRLVLNMTYFRHYEALPANEGEQGGITGGASGGEPTLVKEMKFSHITYNLAEADRVNLGHLENSKGIKIHGLLGMQLFKRFEMIIDYEKSILYLRHIKKKEPASFRSEWFKDADAYQEYRIDLIEDKLVTYGEMAGKKLIFVIDTGAESNVLDSRLPNKIFEHVDITRRIQVSGTGNRKVDALYGDMKNMRIGNVDMGTLPVLVTNLEKLCFSYVKCLDGMLGFDFLSLHKIGFNFVNRKMYIWK